MTSVEGVVRIPIRRFADERGWFSELRRDSALPRPTVQTNVSFSRKGVIRGLHYHERGQDDLFACLQGTARVVVLDRESGATFTEDIGDENPVAVYVPGRHAHGFEAPSLPWAPDLVLHAAAWTNVDGAEDDPQGAAAANVGGTAHAAALGAPLVAFSTDYVFDGAKDAPYVESDAPAPLSVYGRTKLHGEAAAGDRAWVVRSSWLFGETGHNFVRTMLRLGAERDEVSVVDDQRGCPTYVGHLAAATRELVDRGSPFGVWHLAASGDCTWADLAEAVFEEAGLACRVRRITTAEFGRQAPRPAVSILRSERGAPELPHWRDGLRACLRALSATQE